MSYLLAKQPMHKDGLLKAVMMMKLSRVRELHMSCLPPLWEWMKSLCQVVVEMLGVREPRELHEEDFASEDDSEEEENEEIDFESDGDQVLEGYGGEEIEEGDEL
ncbi:hypothetical protein RHMOL_Rhmol10G0162800 [Rhododendron molle]|uniref:Uncharacterized protein n=1 Tax=Rhododendron molle TaxID=49168 RepID=A0ACC0M2Z5_RHOML|nr:hypothetical protein RHMOL_Rhmol10G0162800 [Rhododendron molle]